MAQVFLPIARPSSSFVYGRVIVCVPDRSAFRLTELPASFASMTNIEPPAAFITASIPQAILPARLAKPKSLRTFGCIGINQFLNNGKYLI